MILRLTALLLVLIPQFTSAEAPRRHKSNHYDLNISSHFFSSSANYDTTGAVFEKLPNNGELTLWENQFNLQYGLNNFWGIFGGLNFTQGQSSNSSNNRNRSALADAHIGANLKWKFKKLLIFNDAKVIYPMDNFESDTTEMILNEGALALENKNWIEYKLFKHRLYLMAGLKYQDDGRSALFPWSLGAHRHTKKFFYGAEVGGFEAITDDEDIARPANKLDVTNRVNSGSLKFYSINPSLLYTEAWLGYRWSSKLNFGLSYNKTLNGKNSAEGQSFGFNLTWRTSFSSSITEEKEEFQIKD